MNLIETYNEIYSACKYYNAALMREGKIAREFSDLASFLEQHREEIEHFQLQDAIAYLFGQNEYRREKIEELIEVKREQVAADQRRLKEAEAQRERLRQEEERRRLEEERRRREQEQLKKEKNQKMIKNAFIAVGIALAAFLVISFLIQAVKFISENFGVVLLILGGIGVIVYLIKRRR